MGVYDDDCGFENDDFDGVFGMEDLLEKAC